jgi:hypothetical protein
MDATVKSFKQYVIESPEIHNVPTETWNKLYEKSREHIKTNHESSSKIGNNYYHNTLNGKHVYYRHENNEVKEVSIINKDNQQVSADKGKNGDASHIRNFMHYHAEKHGEVKSDNLQSNGAKHLWKHLISNDHRNKSFSLIKGENSSEVTHETPDEHIWGRNGDYSKTILRMKNEKT